jgi:hypothetical protein
MLGVGQEKEGPCLWETMIVSEGTDDDDDDNSDGGGNFLC